MKITSQQALIMFEVLKWSTSVYGTVGGYDADTRLKITNEILNQQSNEIIDLESQC